MPMSELLSTNPQTSNQVEDEMNEIENVVDYPVFDEGKFTGTVLRATKVPHGHGRMYYNEGDEVQFYDGEFKHGHWHGYGCLTFRSCDSYVGQFVFDQREGKGLYQWYDGRMYEGDFLFDQRHGKGVFTWPDGARYKGDFDEGQRTGQGTYTFADGSSYEGFWKDGKYEGYGIFTWTDGRTYTGEWKNGKQHGLGVETNADGTIKHEGMWFEHKPLEEIRSSTTTTSPAPTEKGDIKRSRRVAGRMKRVSVGEQPASTPLKENGTDESQMRKSPGEENASTVATEVESLGSLLFDDSAADVNPANEEPITGGSQPRRTSIREIFPTDDSIREFFPNEESLRDFFPDDEAIREVFPTDESLRALFTTGSSQELSSSDPAVSISQGSSEDYWTPPNPANDAPRRSSSRTHRPMGTNTRPSGPPMVYATQMSSSPNAPRPPQGRRLSQPQQQRPSLDAHRMSQGNRNLSAGDLSAVKSRTRRRRSSLFGRKQQEAKPEPVTAVPVFDHALENPNCPNFRGIDSHTGQVR